MVSEQSISDLYQAQPVTQNPPNIYIDKDSVSPYVGSLEV